MLTILVEARQEPIAPHPVGCVGNSQTGQEVLSFLPMQEGGIESPRVDHTSSSCSTVHPCSR